jgi:ApbE superfamily uncharacterized protein (UPF0280 family)
MIKSGEKRWYRGLTEASDLIFYNVSIKQSDLYIGSSTKQDKLARNVLKEARNKIEYEIQLRHEFLTSYEPLNYFGGSSDIVSWMYEASSRCGVGPMAAVAGATARYVGEKLCEISGQVIVENGGDLFISTEYNRRVAIYAGDSPLSNKLAIKIKPGKWGVCTSARTIGHSYSSGMADAAVCISNDCALADAAATRLGNSVIDENQLTIGLKDIMNINGIVAAVAIIGDKIAVAGDIELMPIVGG